MKNFKQYLFAFLILILNLILFSCNTAKKNEIENKKGREIGMIKKYDELIKLFTENGYTIKYQDSRGVEAENKNGITFTEMKEDEYFEAGIYISSD